MAKQRKAIPTGRRAVLALACVVVGVGGVGWASQVFRTPVRSTPHQPEAPAAPTRQAPASVSDYSRRVVAYVYGTEPVTREHLGEYLIARRGAEKLQLLVNKRIMEDAAREAGIEVTAAEVEAALAGNLQESRLDWETFETTVKNRYKRSTYEWKEDVTRPRLLLTRLSRKRVRVSNAEVEKLYQARFGEQVQGRLIIYPPEQEKAALEEYNRLRQSDEAFTARAKEQANQLSATAGKVKPFGRGVMGDPTFDDKIFRLKPGEVSELIRTEQGLVLFKCDGRIPANTKVSLEAVQAQLGAEVREQKVQAELQNLFQTLRTKANPQLFLAPADKVEGGVQYTGNDPTPRPGQVVAVYHGNRTVTREELGEFLIVRYGAEKVEELVNHLIIDRVCKERGITVSEAEITEALEQDLKHLKIDRKGFQKRLLSKYSKNLFEWKYDEIRPRLLLKKLCAGRVRVTEDDLARAYEGNYGEKIEGRLILWPADQMKFALTEYPRIRDSEDAFAQAAKMQATPSLAAQGGRVGPIGRGGLGDDNLDREAFRLQEGEVSTLVGTAQGYAVFKCDRRIPPQRHIKLEDPTVRALLTEEVRRKKTELEMRVVFKQLRDQAAPKLMLKNPHKPIDLTAETMRALNSP